MANRFRSLGLPIDSEVDLELLITHTVSRAARGGLPADGHLVFPETGPAQLWLHLHEGQVVSLHPHYSGTARRQVGLIYRVQTDADSPMEGGFYAWSGAEGEPNNGDYPFVFYAPDFRRLDAIPLPSIQQIELTAFADAIAAFPTEEAFHEHQASEGLKYAAKSFLPTGVFEEPNQPMAMFVGTVLSAATERNAVSNLPFVHLEVDTFSGPITVVCASEVIQGTPVVGGIVQVGGWLSGRLHPSSGGVAT